MLPAQNYSPTPTFIPHMTLASINARQSGSESPITTAYPKPWVPSDYPFEIAMPPFLPQDFQSNSTYGSQATFENSASGGLGQTRTGLGIHYAAVEQPTPADLKLTYTPHDISTEYHDTYIPFSGSPRLDVSYSSSGLTFGDPNSSMEGSLNSSWSLSMVFAEMHQESEPGSRNCSEPLTDISTRDPVSNDDFSLESLSAAAGLTVEEFTNKVTQGAKYALEKVSSVTDVGNGVNIYSQPVLQPFNGPSTLTMGDAWYPTGNGINPAEIMPAPILSSGTSLDEMFGILGHNIPYMDSGVEFPRLPELRYPSTPPMSIAVPEALSLPQPSTPGAHRDDADQLSDYEPPPFLSPSSSEYSPSFGSSRQYHTRASRIKKRKPATCDTPETTASATLPEPSLELPTNLPPIDLGSPVFDAHRGIDIEDLKARAERYRLRNQGREYDKRWLLSYAGKLSSKGELLEEFRCYVTGCQQVNKRRDHILIHVGAHLDQRPFKCVHWYVHCH